MIEEFTTEFINQNTLERVTVHKINLPNNNTIYRLRLYDKYQNLLSTCERNTREEYRTKAKEMLGVTKFRDSY